jgi:hypothetical protein
MLQLGEAVLHGVVLQAAACCAPAREVIAWLGLLQAGLLFLVQAFLAVGACWQRLHSRSILHGCLCPAQSLASPMLADLTKLHMLCWLQERAFELGERLDVLSQVSQPAIIPHMAEVEGKRFPYEVRLVWQQWLGYGSSMQPHACLLAQDGVYAAAACEADAQHVFTGMS